MLVNVAVFENGRFVVEDVITAREAGTLTSFVVRTRPFVPGCFVRISLFGNRVSQERISLFGRCGPLVAGIVRVLEGFAPVTGRDPVVFGELATPAQTTATPAN